MSHPDPPRDVVEIRRALSRFLSDTSDREGRSIGSATHGVYLFYDYDGEPIYVGQTREGLRGRIGRHLTGQRSDAVAKYILDPFEVLEIEVWPAFHIGSESQSAQKEYLDRLEFAVYAKAVSESRFGAILNEGSIREWREPFALPASYRGRIVPPDLYAERRHPDVRIARRAQTIASLTRHIAERRVGPGIRATLRVQAQRLEWLAKEREQAMVTGRAGAADEGLDE